MTEQRAQRMLNRIDYNNMAKVAIDMAKYVDKIRPDVIILPLRSGHLPGKLVMEALRSNLDVSVSEYDPPLVYMCLNHHSYCHPEEDLKKLKERRPNWKKIMIIDSTNRGASPSTYLECLLKESKGLDEIHVNFMGANRREDQKNNLDEFLEHFKFNISRLKEKCILFDDESDIIGMERDITRRGNFHMFNYHPFGFTAPHENLREKQKASEEFFSRAKKAIDRKGRMRRKIKGFLNKILKT